MLTDFCSNIILETGYMWGQFSNNYYNCARGDEAEAEVVVPVIGIVPVPVIRLAVRRIIIVATTTVNTVRTISRRFTHITLNFQLHFYAILYNMKFS